jgi:hypothetical protein
MKPEMAKTVSFFRHFIFGGCIQERLYEKLSEVRKESWRGLDFLEI